MAASQVPNRATLNEPTRITPNLLSMGGEIRLPGELVFGITNNYDGEEITSSGEYGEYEDILKSSVQLRMR